jgi:poly(A) polymerase
MAETPEKTISAAGIPVYLHGFSAIDAYLNQNAITATHVLCGADLADLARLFEGLRYPGAAFADAAVDADGKTWYFRCHDPGDIRNYPGSSFTFLEFYQDCNNRRFYDPNGIYPLLRRIRDGVDYADKSTLEQNSIAECWKTFKANTDPCRALIDQAIILAKYFPETSSREINAIAEEFHNHNSAIPPGAEEQRLLLTTLLEAANPAPGFELLKSSGFITAYWPELALLDDVDHSKEFHPEGNVWKHTMETLRYRKSAGLQRRPGLQGRPRKKSRRDGGFEPQLSLGLLLHDIGKPLSNSAGSRRFDGHAELGERQARRFLERLGFDSPLIHDVCFLVRNHMLPAALPRLPLVRTGDIMASPLFPALLELYRCDESSSFKGLDGYYQSSAAYQSYLRYRRNPYRTETLLSGISY